MDSYRTVQIVKQNTFNVRSIIREVISKKVDEEDPFYVCHIDDIIKKYQIWKEKFPRVDPYYAVKCNDDQLVLETLAALGTGFDCASKTELSRIIAICVSPDRIIYAKPTKQISTIKYAKCVGVTTMTFDNEYELHKIKELYPDARLVIRIYVKDPDSRCVLAEKFGCNPEYEALHLLRVAKSLNLTIIGVSFHVGWGHKPTIYRDAISAAKHVFDDAKAVGYDFDLLNIGGGYPGESYNSIEEIVQVVNTALDDFFPDPKIRVMSEPGTFFVASAYTLACNIHSIRDTTRTNGVGKLKKHKMYYINDGVYGSFNNWCQDNFHPEPLEENLKTDRYSSSLWGPTCDGVDRVLEDVDLPEMHINDWIIFRNFGAYSVSVCSQFNGLPVPKVFHFIGEKNWFWTSVYGSVPKRYVYIGEEEGQIGKIIATTICTAGGGHLVNQGGKTTQVSLSPSERHMQPKQFHQQ